MHLEDMKESVYSVSQKILLLLLTCSEIYFSKTKKIVNDIVHAYSAFKSTPNYKFSFNYP